MPKTNIFFVIILVPCGIFDDPAIVAEIKQAAETIRKSMAQSNDLHSGLTASNSAQEMNQMVRYCIMTFCLTFTFAA